MLLFEFDALLVTFDVGLGDNDGSEMLPVEVVVQEALVAISVRVVVTLWLQEDVMVAVTLAPVAVN